MPLSTSPANVRRETSEKKWEEAWTWSKNRVRGRKYGMPRTMRQNNTVGTRIEEDGRAVPPTRNGALPHEAVPGVGKELGHGRVRVVSI